MSAPDNLEPGLTISEAIHRVAAHVLSGRPMPPDSAAVRAACDRLKADAEKKRARGALPPDVEKRLAALPMNSTT